MGDAKIGSISGWKKFAKAVKKYFILEKTLPYIEALHIVYETYSIRLIPAQKWTATKGTPGVRKGPELNPVIQNQKPGPKPKMSAGTRRHCWQLADRNPNLSNEGIAQKLNQRLS